MEGPAICLSGRAGWNQELAPSWTPGPCMWVTGLFTRRLTPPENLCPQLLPLPAAKPGHAGGQLCLKCSRYETEYLMHQSSFLHSEFSLQGSA